MLYGTVYICEADGERKTDREKERAREIKRERERDVINTESGYVA